jgi:hypothetical protein
MLPREANDDWPVLGAALGELPVGAIFESHPDGCGHGGVATLCSDRPFMLDHHQQTTALMIASAIAAGAVQQVMVSSRPMTRLEFGGARASRREVSPRPPASSGSAEHDCDYRARADKQVTLLPTR